MKKMYINKPASFALLLLFSISGCNAEYEDEIPAHIQNLDNLIFIETEESPLHQIHLEREMEFGSSDDLIIGGLGSFVVDESNRVYIGDTQQHTITIFDENGQYAASLGRQGRGPGEFQFVGYQRIVDSLLFVVDPPQFRLNVFSLEDLEVYETIPRTVNNKGDFEELNELDLGSMIPVSKNKFLGVFSTLVIFTDPSHPDYNLNDRINLYYLIDDTGEIISDKIFQKPAYRGLTATVNGELRSTQFEFLGRTLLAISDNQKIYMARSEEFLIKIYDSNGEYLRAFYYPFQKRAFTREAAIRQQEREYEEGVVEWRVSVIRNAVEENIPETWPALNDLLVDDENRIWVSTIIDPDDEYEWWVLEETGELLARFHWPIDEPIEVVKDGYAYARETDRDTDLQRVVRYRIEFEEV